MITSYSNRVVKRLKEIEIEVFRDANGSYWMLTTDFEKLAPNLEVDSSRIIKVAIIEGNNNK